MQVNGHNFGSEGCIMAMRPLVNIIRHPVCIFSEARGFGSSGTPTACLSASCPKHSPPCWGRLHVPNPEQHTAHGPEPCCSARPAPNFAGTHARPGLCVAPRLPALALCRAQLCRCGGRGQATEPDGQPRVAPCKTTV